LNWAGANLGPGCGIHGDRLDFFSSLGVHEPRQLAASNAELVADIAGLSRQLGRAIATSDQAREMLLVPKR
jgi:beta-keto acid cleavage enzyme